MSQAPSRTPSISNSRQVARRTHSRSSDVDTQGPPSTQTAATAAAKQAKREERNAVHLAGPELARLRDKHILTRNLEDIPNDLSKLEEKLRRVKLERERLEQEKLQDDNKLAEKLERLQELQRLMKLEVD